MEPTQNLSNEPAGIPPIANNPQKSNSFLLIVIGLVVISVVGVGGFLLGKYLYSPKETPSQPVVSVPTIAPTALPTIDQTSGKENWKTYTSTKYGIEFKYPQNLVPTEDIGGIFLNSQSKIPSGPNLSIDLADQMNLDTLRKISEEEAIRQSSSKIVSESTYMIGLNKSIPALKLKINQYLDSGGSYIDERIYFKNSLHAFAINLTNRSSQDREIVDQILFTLKFTQ